MLVIDRYSVRRDGKHWFGLAVWKWEGSLMTSVQVIDLPEHEACGPLLTLCCSQGRALMS